MALRPRLPLPQLRMACTAETSARAAARERAATPLCTARRSGASTRAPTRASTPTGPARRCCGTTASSAAPSTAAWSGGSSRWVARQRPARCSGQLGAAFAAGASPCAAADPSPAPSAAADSSSHPRCTARQPSQRRRRRLNPCHVSLLHPPAISPRPDWHLSSVAPRQRQALPPISARDKRSWFTSSPC